MNTNNLNEKETLALTKVRLEYTENYNGLVDSIYNYMESYINGDNLCSTMYMDEIENMIGINTHEELIIYILGGER